jgi:hypothetical protein
LNDHRCLIVQLPPHYCTSKYHLKYFLFQSYHSLLSLIFYFCLMKLTKYYLYFLKISYLNIEQNLVYLLINLKKWLFPFALCILLIYKYIGMMDILILISELQLFQFSLIKIFQLNYLVVDCLKVMKREHRKYYLNFFLKKYFLSLNCLP